MIFPLIFKVEQEYISEKNPFHFIESDFFYVKLFKVSGSNFLLNSTNVLYCEFYSDIFF